MRRDAVRAPDQGRRGLSRVIAGFATAAAAAVIAGCSPTPPGPGLDGERVIGHVRELAETIGSRPAGSAGSQRAAAYIEAALAAAGASSERWPVGDIDVPQIAVGPMVFVRPHRVHSTGDDIVARFGPDESGALLLMAHYDTVPESPGAVDDAVSIGILLELARELAAHPPARPVWLGFTADEEIGLVGARRLAEALGDHVRFAIALDMIGTEGALIVNGASELIRADELRWLADAADAAGVDLEAPWPHRLVSRWWPQLERADHGAFTIRGIRAIHLMNRGADGERIYLAYHTGRDRLDRVSRSAVATAGRLVRALAVRPPPAPSHGDPGVWLPVPGNLVVPRWSFIAAAIGLVLVAALGLIAGRRPLQPGPGLFAAAAVWIVAAGLAFAIERLTRGAHPAPWAHAPLRHELGLGLVLAGAAVLVATAVARWRPWAGSDRYAAAAVVWNLALGCGLAAIGAVEIAWLYLVPAALLAWAPRGRVLGIVTAVAALAPTLALLAPGLVRELYFHGFIADVMPMSGWLALHGVTAALIAAHLASRLRPWGPGASFVLPALAATAILVGIAALVTYQPPCTRGALAIRKLSCELD